MSALSADGAGATDLIRRARRCLPVALLGLAMVGCTPTYTRQAAVEVAGEARLIDDVAVRRTNDRLLNRRAPVCLVASDTLPQHTALLDEARRSLGRYFTAVGVAPRPMNALEMGAVKPCPAATYLLHFDRLCRPADCRRDDPMLIKIVHQSDGSLVDIVELHLRGGWWRLGFVSNRQWRRALDQLGAAITAS